MPPVASSLQAKLIIAFSVVVLVALALAAVIFVIIRRGDQEQQQLDRVLAASPSIYGRFFVLQERGAPDEVMLEFVAAAAEGVDARVLLIDRTNGVVLADSGAELAGESLVVPDELTIERPATLLGQPYVSWEPEGGTPGEGLVMVAELPSNALRRAVSPRTERYWLFLAVPESTIADAWRGLLPGLLLAAAVSLPVAVLLAVVIARYITRPLAQLTTATHQMAEGSFDVDVSVDRADELGRLAQSFSAMAQRVGDAHTQQRALVANVSHDLKTPLTSILGFAQALRDGRSASDADAQRMGAVIHDEASRMTARLNDLLYLSELESGQALLQRDAIDLRKLLEQTVERVGPDAAQRGVDVHTELADATVQADGPKLERAVENLLDNARKYTPSGGEIIVRNAMNNGTAQIELSNTAPDISAEELPRLFERFYRRDRSRGAKEDGSGLGLPIARDLIELHGGTIDASVRDGELVFTVRLPA